MSRSGSNPRHIQARPETRILPAKNILHVFKCLKRVVEMCKFVHDGPQPIPSSGAVSLVEMRSGFGASNGPHLPVEYSQ